MSNCFTVQNIAGRGSGLVTSRAVQAGEEVLTELPLLLTVAPKTSLAVCAACLRQTGSTAVTCTGCHRFAFCGQSCCDSGSRRPDIHSPWLCRALQQLGSLGDEVRSAAHLLLQVCALMLAAHSDAESNARLAALTRLAAAMDSSAPLPSTAETAYSAALSSCNGQLPISAYEAARLLALDQRTSYGIMAPSVEGGHRQIRGSAFYATASLINHECMPNVARFDDYDGMAEAPANTAVRFRALHDLPAGEELTQSYFPLVWSFPERAAACREQYGFDCSCPRCKVEQTWEADDDRMSDASDSSLTHAEAMDGIAESSNQGPMDDMDNYISMFITKFVCPQQDCFGTMAPDMPGSNMLECNMCASKRTEAEILAELGIA